MASGGLGGGGLVFGGRVVAVIGLGGDGGGALVKITWRGGGLVAISPQSGGGWPPFRRTSRRRVATSQPDQRARKDDRQF